MPQEIESDKVYKNKEEARAAYEAATQAIEDVLNKHSAWQGLDDPWASAYVSVNYLDENGKQQRSSFSDACRWDPCDSDLTTDTSQLNG